LLQRAQGHEHDLGRNLDSVLAKPRRFLLSSASFRAAIFTAGFAVSVKPALRAASAKELAQLPRAAAIISACTRVREADHFMTSDEQAIRDLVALWHSATAAGDVEAVLGLMAEDVVFLGAGRPPMRGRRSFESGLRKLLATHRIESTGDVKEVAISGDLAYCWTDLTVRVVPKSSGTAATRSGSTLSILRKQASGSWLVVRDANMLPPA
jgi:uncharacterized protein (TIGR02246 family)